MSLRVLLADADGTLFDFHRGEAVAIGETFRRFGIPDTPGNLEIYSRVNHAQWLRLCLLYTSHPLRILERKLLEPVEQFQRFLVAVLDGLEPAAALVLQRGVMLGFLMEAHIQAGERFHAFTLHLLSVAPELVGADQLAELCAPVAQIVDGDRFVAQKVEDAAKALACLLYTSRCV